MRKTGIALLVTLFLLVTVTGVAFAITYGEPDTEHPHVGLVGFFDIDGNWMWRCSGTLLSDTVFLTAGHCTSPDFPANPDYAPHSAMVWFGDKIELDPVLEKYPDLECYEKPPGKLKWTTYPCVGGIPGEPIANPLYKGLYIPDTHDVGVVILEGPIPEEAGNDYGVLPPAGFLDELSVTNGADGVNFMSVGYGLNQVLPETISLRERWFSVSFLINLTNALTDGYNIQTSNNPGGWPDDPMAYSGGTCFGDSGGPLFYEVDEVTEYLVGITSFGLNASCKGTDFAYRTDTESFWEFIEGGEYFP
ncbi:MAG: trypsin-like serine protease [Anaerolineales bacterium]|nr:trypsin-like serine protease [Anaerolineales bacterium]